jgi:glycosyltransferase involved in cell wall biosynthesis
MKPLRVCIPIEFKPEGGGHYFLRSFADYVVANGGEISRNVTDACDVVFTNHWMTPVREIAKCIQNNPDVRVVQRIDGVAQDYGRNGEADQRQGKVNTWADLTVFQSFYSRFASREKFPVIKHDGPVIHNPVDLENFNPAGSKRELPGALKVVCVSWSTNPKKGSADIYLVASQNPQADFFLCGNFPDAPDLSNVHTLGLLDRQDLAETLRSCDFMLTFSKNEACPNHVLEALASGLPVLFDDSGAMSEIIGSCGLPVTVDSFAKQSDHLLKELTSLSMKARNWAVEKFAPQKIFAQYLDEIEKSLVAPTTIKPIPRRLRAFALGALGI